MAKYRIRIIRDEDPTSPRENDNVGTIVTWHRRYKLGDEQPSVSSREWYEFHSAEAGVMLPLYLYDHSGLTLSVSPFSCPWDSGQIGYIYCNTAKGREEGFVGTDAEIQAILEQALKAEIEEYNKYLSGDCWGFILEEIPKACEHCGVTPPPKQLDSCWGFLGSDWHKNGMIDHWTVPAEECEIVTEE